MPKKHYCPKMHAEGEVCPLCEDTGLVDHETFCAYMKLRRETRQLDREFQERMARER